MNLSITPGTNNVGAYINNVDLTNLNNNQATEASSLPNLSTAPARGPHKLFAL